MFVCFRFGQGQTKPVVVNAFRRLSADSKSDLKLALRTLSAKVKATAGDESFLELASMLQ